MTRPWWIALAQLALGVGLVVLAALVPDAAAAHEVGVWLLGSAVGGALLPAVTKPRGES